MVTSHPRSVCVVTFVCCYVLCSKYLSKGSFSYQGVNFIAVHPLLPILDDVVIVIIVVPIVKNFPFFFVTGVFTLTLLVASLLFCIIHLQIQNERKFKHSFSAQVSTLKQRRKVYLQSTIFT